MVAPLRVPLDQTPLFFPWQVREPQSCHTFLSPSLLSNLKTAISLFLEQDWALGVLHMKIICAVTMMGPNWWLKRALEQVTHNDLIHQPAKAVLPCTSSRSACLVVKCCSNYSPCRS